MAFGEPASLAAVQATDGQATGGQATGGQATSGQATANASQRTLKFTPSDRLAVEDLLVSSQAEGYAFWFGKTDSGAGSQHWPPPTHLSSWRWSIPIPSASTAVAARRWRRQQQDWSHRTPLRGWQLSCTQLRGAYALHRSRVIRHRWMRTLWPPVPDGSALRRHDAFSRRMMTTTRPGPRGSWLHDRSDATRTGSGGSARLRCLRAPRGSACQAPPIGRTNMATWPIRSRPMIVASSYRWVCCGLVEAAIWMCCHVMDTVHRNKLSVDGSISKG